MSTLVAIAYDDVAKAEEVRSVLVQATKEQLIVLDDAVVVSRQSDGKVKLHQGVSMSGAGAAGGALWGGLIGLLFLAPLVGMAIGAASGAAAGAMSDAGVDDKFMKDLGAKLEPGAGALILLVRSSTPDKILPRVQQYGGHVIQTSLSAADEDRLRTALGEQPAPTA